MTSTTANKTVTNTTGTIDVTHDGDVAVVKLNSGIKNPIGIDMTRQLTDFLRAAKDDDRVRGLVLTTANSQFFSIGVDVPPLFEMEREEFADFFHAFNGLCLELLSFPKPTTAAIGGHAVGGGCVLAICCDYRFISEGKKKMGLNEMKLGVAIPLLVANVLRGLVGFRTARDISESGRFHGPEECLKMGLVDRVVNHDDLLHTAIKTTKYRAAMPAKAFAVTKENRQGAMVADFLQRREEEEKNFVDCWFTPQTRGILENALKKF